MMESETPWLPDIEDWTARLRQIPVDDGPAWSEMVSLANSRMDFVRTERLSAVLKRRFPLPPPNLSTKPVRLALLGSATMGHLHASLCIAGLRRGLHVTVYENDYGQYFQELSDPTSALHAFKPTVVLFALDGHHLTNGVEVGADRAAADDVVAGVLRTIGHCWGLARQAFGCSVLQQAALQVHPALMGSNEHRFPTSKRAVIDRINAELRDAADAAGVDMLTLEGTGGTVWHDPALWHRAKQEVTPLVAPLYGERVGRMIAAQQGRSAKCLVLDLDNTLWGGVIGDDGLDGIVLGNGDAAGEAFVAFQTYARDLSKRGVILAVCSKNDEKNALEAFEKHPEMVLRRSDIACFKANWSDKASNLRDIAAELNIGLDALVFADDNPFERALVRRELPMVAVPELPEDPAFYSRCLAAAGYFESLSITDEDRARSAQYQQNRARDVLRSSATDLSSYLRDLDMRLLWRAFDRVGAQRVVQLINKTNQFNLTTRRYTQEEVAEIGADDASFGLQFRLLDRFGDNGIIAIVIGRLVGTDVDIDTWLMSCRVLGRNVEEATLSVVVAEARRHRADRLTGTYRPTAKNGMVKDHYQKLGFSLLETTDAGVTRWGLSLSDHRETATLIDIVEG